MNALTELARAVAGHGAGFPASVKSPDVIPAGWVALSYFPSRDRVSDASDYIGPLLEENADWISIDVFGAPFTVSKDRVIVTRSAFDQ